MTTYSYSRLTTFHNCEYCYYLSYIQKQKGVQNAYAYLGGITHEQLERLQVGEITIEQAIQQFELGSTEAEFMGYTFPNENIRNSYNNAVKHYIKNFVAYDCKDCEIEGKFTIDIDGIELIGFIDLLLFNEDGTVSIIDHKTSSEYTKKDKAKHGRQLILYGIACQQRGLEVKEIGWSMLKYARVKVGKGRSKKVARNKIGTEFYNQIKALVDECDMIEDLKESTMEHLRTTGDTTCLPKEVQEQIHIEPLLSMHEFSEENIQETLDFIKDTVAQIEAKSEDEMDWKPVEINQQTSFFCSNLCNHRNTCKFLKAYHQANSSKYERKLDSYKDSFDYLLL